jgi:hypothetical protein
MVVETTGAHVAFEDELAITGLAADVTAVLAHVNGSEAVGTGNLL